MKTVEASCSINMRAITYHQYEQPVSLYNGPMTTFRQRLGGEPMSRRNTAKLNIYLIKYEIEK